MNLLPLLVVSLGLNATSTPVPPFEFSPPGQLSLNWTLPDAGRAGAPDAGAQGDTPLPRGGVDLLNNERVQRDILLDLQLRKPDGELVDTARLLTLRPLGMADGGAPADGATVLPAAGALRIQVLARDVASAAPATLTGYLTASEPSGRYVARVPVQLQLTQATAPAAQTGAQPLVDTLTTQVTTWPVCFVRGKPHGERLWLPADAQLPEQKPDQKDGPRLPEERLGVLVGSQGGTAQVSSTGVYEKDKGLKLALGCMDRPGEYTGKIEVSSPSGKKEVKLTVSAKHKAIFAVLTLTLGVLAAGLFQWHSTVTRERNKLKARVEGLSNQLQGALQDTALQPIREDAEEALKEWNTAVTKQLDQVTDFGSTSVAHQAVLAELTTMEQRIQAFARFPTLAQETPAAVEKALRQWPARVQPSTRLPEPMFAANLPSLIQPPTFASAVSQLKELEGVKAFATVFEEAGTRLQRVHAWTQAQQALQSPALTVTEEVRFQSARELQSKVRHDFWHAVNLEELSERNTLVELKQAEAHLASLDYRIPGERAKAVGAMEVTRGLVPALLSILMGGPQAPEGARPDYSAREQWAISRLMVSNLGVLFVSTAVAVVSGLNELYFSKPFGLWSDYLQAFFWGVLTQVTLAAAVGSIPQLLGSLKQGPRR
ncbi:MAG: hypothetical protein JXB05_37375 [Myxococcaceae bacterium]|nr:hypothetical protein [Myxococcaceae bacterium]